MTRDEIIVMARGQGLPETSTEGVFIVNTDDLGRMLAAEREACAKVCENEHKQRELYFEQTGNGMPTVGLLVSAAAIRARGEK